MIRAHPAMARAPRAIVPEEPEEASVWSAVVLMASSVGAFALFALFLAHNHRWTDALLDSLPEIGRSVRPAADGVVAEQIRIEDVKTEHLTLADRSVALLFEAAVVNDAGMPVRDIVIGVEGWRDGNRVAEGEGTCGKNVSVRLLKRLSRNEVSALMRMDPPARGDLEPGSRTDCQVTLTQLKTEIEEVRFRVSAASPTPDHLPSDPSIPIPSE